MPAHHTPGPLRFDSKGIIYDAEGPIGQVFDNPGEEVAMCNAALWSAAPALLAALEAAEEAEQALVAYEDFRQPSDSEASSDVWDRYLAEKDRLQAEWQRLDKIANTLRAAALSAVSNKALG